MLSGIIKGLVAFWLIAFTLLAVFFVLTMFMGMR